MVHREGSRSREGSQAKGKVARLGDSGKAPVTGVPRVKRSQKVGLFMIIRFVLLEAVMCKRIFIILEFVIVVSLQ